MKSFTPRISEGLTVILLALFNILIHLLVIRNLEYHRDELLYFSLGQHPAFGYASVPPMIGWIAWLMEHTFGYSLFAVRIIPALASGVMVILVAAIASELGGGSYARILACIGFTIAAFGLRTYSLFMPVYIDIFFWTLIIYYIIRYINTNSGKILILLGFVAGLSLLNKYLIAILFFSLLIVIPFTENRKTFHNSDFWLGIAAGLLVFLPNLIWQFVNRLPVINHMAELQRTQLAHVDKLSFLTDQVIMSSFASFLTISGIIYLMSNKDMRKYRFLGIVTFLVVFIIMLLRGKGYYTLGVFPFLIAAGSVRYEKWLKRTWIRVAFPVMLVLLTIPMLPTGLPVFKAKGLLTYFKNAETKYGIVTGRKFEDGTIHSLPQDYADMLGWEELTQVASTAYNKIEDKNAAIIYGENYGEAGAINIIGKKYGLPEPISFSESFQYWVPKQFDPDITSVVYINHNPPGEDVRTLFRKITVVGSITNVDSREYGTTVYLCQDPVQSFNSFWTERLKKFYETGK
jgi:Dolichyl-phosphate-mannose-protein mannosyltransferase